jgi:hypothetical protein
VIYLSSMKFSDNEVKEHWLEMHYKASERDSWASTSKNPFPVVDHDFI